MIKDPLNKRGFILLILRQDKIALQLHYNYHLLQPLLKLHKCLQKINIWV